MTLKGISYQEVNNIKSNIPQNQRIGTLIMASWHVGQITSSQFLCQKIIQVHLHLSIGDVHVQSKPHYSFPLVSHSLEPYVGASLSQSTQTTKTKPRVKRKKLLKISAGHKLINNVQCLKWFLIFKRQQKSIIFSNNPLYQLLPPFLNIGHISLIWLN